VSGSKVLTEIISHISLIGVSSYAAGIYDKR
jgi:hypothetical protein